ncbi:MAG: hypothetical protein JSR45_01855 [Proteobacteria bacterium]|nr:hypothetical protein [Pseudomonadota bacterium]
MSDRLFFASAALLAVLLVGLAFVWPQGQGRRSPGPFGKPEVITDAARKDLADEAKRQAGPAKAAAPAAAASPASTAATQAAPVTAAAAGLRR